MKNISKANINKWKRGEVNFSPFIMYKNEKIKEDIIEFETNDILGEAIIGNIRYMEISIILLNADKYDLTEKNITIGYESELGEEVLGIFFVKSATKQDRKNDEIKIIAVSRDYLLNTKLGIIRSNKITSIDNTIFYEDFSNKNLLTSDAKYETRRDFIKELAMALGGNYDSLTNTIKKVNKENNLVLTDSELYELNDDDDEVKSINSVVLSRIDLGDGKTTDDVYSSDIEDIKKNGSNEFKIIGNQLVDNDRGNFSKGLLKELLGISYKPCEIEIDLSPFIEVGDNLKVRDFNVIAMEVNHNFKTRVTTIKCSKKTKTETDYKKATPKELLTRTEIKIDKANQKIESLVEKEEENSKKITKITQDLDGLTLQVSNTTKLEKEVEGGYDITIDKALERDAIEFVIKEDIEIFNNFYPSDFIFPSDNTFPRGNC